MEILDSSETFLQWDRNLSELSEAGDHDNVLYSTVSRSSRMERRSFLPVIFVNARLISRPPPPQKKISQVRVLGIFFVCFWRWSRGTPEEVPGSFGSRGMKLKRCRSSSHLAP